MNRITNKLFICQETRGKSSGIQNAKVRLEVLETVFVTYVQLARCFSPHIKFNGGGKRLFGKRCVIAEKRDVRP